MTMPQLLELQPAGEHRYNAPFEQQEARAHDVVYGGQILAQMIMASAGEHDPAKTVKSIHVAFSRAATYAEPLLYEVETLHEGRTFASDTVTCAQRGVVMARGLVLLDVEEPDLIRHTSVTMPTVPAPEERSARSDGRLFPGAVMCGGLDESGEQRSRDPVQYVWLRYPPGSLSAAAGKAVLACATDGFLIGTAMLPHEGYDESLAHHSVSTGVVSHTISFHEPFASDEWLLLANESVWAGHGRAHGRCDVFKDDGTLVANCTQDAFVRSMATDPADPRTPARRM
jgi:acyl-CoA thioesterase II